MELATGELLRRRLLMLNNLQKMEMFIFLPSQKNSMGGID